MGEWRKLQVAGRKLKVFVLSKEQKVQECDATEASFLFNCQAQKNQKSSIGSKIIKRIHSTV